MRNSLADNRDSEGGRLLEGAYRYLVDKLGADPDELAHEWAEGIIGDQYPTPPRILKYTEAIIQPYLAQELGNRDAGEGRELDLFATEAEQPPCAIPSTLSRPTTSSKKATA